MIWFGRAVSEDILLSTFTEAKFTVCEELWSVWVGRQAKRLLRACSCEQLQCRYRQISDAPSRIEGKSLVPSHYPRGRVPITQFFAKHPIATHRKLGVKLQSLAGWSIRFRSWIHVVHSNIRSKEAWLCTHQHPACTSRSRTFSQVDGLASPEEG